MRMIIAVLLFLVVAACAPAPTVTPPTATDVPSTPFPTDTPGVTPTDEPGVPIEPFPDAPACPSHDDTLWHGLWDAERGCHFDHTHGDNPAALDHIFGPLPDYITGISGHHETPGENMNKHEGYKWFVVAVDQCGFDRSPEVSVRDTCVLAARVMIHNLGGPRDALVRFHSIWGQFLVCDEDDLGDCGTVTVGHWADFGILVVPYKGEHVPLLGDPPGSNFDVNSPGYRGHTPPESCPNSSGQCTYTWLSDNQKYLGGLPIIHKWGVRSFDDVPINPDNPEELLTFDGDFNHSNFQIFAMWVWVPASLDMDGDGHVTFSGLVNQYGHVVESCDGALVCSPLEIVGAPVGLAQFAVRVEATGEDEIEHDIFFDGESSGWIGPNN